MTDSQLDVLDPPGRRVTFAGNAVTITPLTLGQLPAFARALAPISADIDILELADGASDGAAIGAILSLIGTHGDALFQALAIATPLQPNELRGARDLSGLAALAVAVFRENADFFGPQVTTSLQAVREAVDVAAQQATKTDGSTPSTPLSAPATTAAT